MGLRTARRTAALLGLVVLVWQVGNAARGRFVHEFLIADLVLAPVLIAASALRPDRRAAAAMFGGFAALGGVFLSASTMRLLGGGYDLGTGMATLGLFVCLGWSVALGNRLANP